RHNVPIDNLPLPISWYRNRNYRTITFRTLLSAPEDISTRQTPRLPSGRLITSRVPGAVLLLVISQPSISITLISAARRKIGRRIGD
ncbi:MAG: hypothetical protein ABIR47_06560, partial [Candidatus Kapaibacterium sp.]